MTTGKVTRYFENRGFGFVQPDAGGSTLFFHIKSVDPTWEFDDVPEGSRVEFEIGEGRDGRQEARHIKVLA